MNKTSRVRWNMDEKKKLAVESEMVMKEKGLRFLKAIRIAQLVLPENRRREILSLQQVGDIKLLVENPSVMIKDITSEKKVTVTIASPEHPAKRKPEVYPSFDKPMAPRSSMDEIKHVLMIALTPVVRSIKKLEEKIANISIPVEMKVETGINSSELTGEINKSQLQEIADELFLRTIDTVVDITINEVEKRLTKVDGLIGESTKRLHEAIGKSEVKPTKVFNKMNVLVVGILDRQKSDIKRGLEDKYNFTFIDSQKPNVQQIVDTARKKDLVLYNSMFLKHCKINQIEASSSARFVKYHGGISSVKELLEKEWVEK